MTGLARLHVRGGFIGTEVSGLLLSAMASDAPTVREVAFEAFDILGDLASVHPRVVAEAATALLLSPDPRRVTRGIELLGAEDADIDFAVPALIKGLYRADRDASEQIGRLLERSGLPAAKGAVERLGRAPGGRVAPAERAAAAAPAVSASRRSSLAASRFGQRRTSRDGERPADGPIILQEPPDTYRADLRALRRAGFSKSGESSRTPSTEPEMEADTGEHPVVDEDES